MSSKASNSRRSHWLAVMEFNSNGWVRFIHLATQRVTEQGGHISITTCERF